MLLDSMEDAAQEAYIYYHGRRFDAMSHPKIYYFGLCIENTK
jgi:hypothetical protein